MDEDVPAVKRPRTATAPTGPPPPPPSSRIPQLPTPAARRSSVRSHQASRLSRPDEEDFLLQPQLGDDTLQFLDNTPPNDSMLEDDPPGDGSGDAEDDRRLTAGPQLLDDSVVSGRPSEPAPAERSTLGEETTSGFVGRQVARLFDKTLDDVSESTVPPSAATSAPRPLPTVPLPAPHGVPLSPFGLGVLHTTAPPTESTLFTLPPPARAPAVPLEIFEEATELTVPNLQSTATTINDTRASLTVMEEWEREEAEPPASRLALCRPLLPVGLPREAYADLPRREMHAVILAALENHLLYRREPKALGDTSFLPPFVPEDYSRRLKVPQHRPTLCLGSTKFEVLHRLTASRPALYSARCPNPPPPDYRPPSAPCPTAVELQELCVRDLTCLKLGPPEALRWEFYLGCELKARVPAPDRRRFLLPCGESYEFPDVAVLQLACNPNPSLEDYYRLVQGREAISEDLVIFWAIEMLKALEGLLAADVVHGAVDLSAWLLRDFPIEDDHWHNWAREGAMGWEYKGLTLADFSQGLDLRLFAQPEAARFVGGAPDRPPCPEQAAHRPWRHHVDAFGVARCLHQLLLQLPIELHQVVEKDVQIWRQTVLFKRWQQREVWQVVFDTLLNLPPVVPPELVRGCREQLEGLLAPHHRASSLKISLKQVRSKVWGC
eukprot:EG_transcript_4679